MWALKTRPWVPIVRAALLITAVAVALSSRGWATAAVFGGWAMLDGAAVLGGAARRYDEGSPWGTALIEGFSQLLLAVLACMWWTTGPTAFGRALGIVVAAAASAVVIAGIRQVWFGLPDGRVAPGAVASLALIGMAFAADGASPERLATALGIYTAVFAAASAIGAIRLGLLARSGDRRLALPAALSAAIVLALAAIAGAFAALGRL